MRKLKSAGVILPGGGEIAWPFKVGEREHSALLPYDLLPAKTYQIGLGAESLAYLVAERGHGGTVQLRAFHRDHKGLTFKSKPVELNVDFWTALPQVG